MTYREDYIGFVYLWENTHPDANQHKFYIGQHLGCVEDGYIGSGVIFTKKYFCKKYRGFWKRTIVEYCKTEEELNNAEIKYIVEHNACTSALYCNIREGGKNGKHSTVTKLKNSAANKGRIPWNKNKKGLITQSKKTLTKKREKQKNYYAVEFEKREHFTLNYIKENSYIKVATLKQQFSVAKARKTLKSLLHKQKIKPMHFGYNDLRYVDYNFSLESEIINLLRYDSGAFFSDIAEFMSNKYQVAKFTIYSILKKIAAEKQIVTYMAKKQNSKNKSLFASIK
jgi:hypothetical protein